MNKAYIYNGIRYKYPELANYLELIATRQRENLYRESFLYMRLAEEYIIEILAKKHHLSMMDLNNEIPNMYSYRTIYSLSEELYSKGFLSEDEKVSHDNIRRYSNAALHRGVDESFFKKIWNSCYESIFYVSSALVDDINDFSDETMTIYTEGDFLRKIEEEFPHKMYTDNDFSEAVNIFTQRIKLNTLDVEKAKSVVDYFIQAIKGGTLPMLAVTYAIKISQK